MTFSTPSPAAPRSTASTGLRERKKQARRQALVTASHELVARHGLDAVTVEMICDTVGVSPRTFFNYFESKVDAVLGIQPWALDPDVSEGFATGGPTGETLADCAVLAQSILAAAPIDIDRMAEVMELSRREPALLVRQIAWFEECAGEIEALAARRRGVEVVGALEKTLSAVVMLLVKSSVMHWDDAERTTTPSVYTPQALAGLRTLLCPASPQ